MVVPIGTPDVPFDDPIWSRPVVGFRIVIFSAEISTMKINDYVQWMKRLTQRLGNAACKVWCK